MSSSAGKPAPVAVRPTFARVDLDAVRANYAAVARHVDGPAAPLVIAVVKANAYGHGAVPVARALESAGAGMLACADIEEAVTLREGGIRAPVLVFGALSVSDSGRRVHPRTDPDRLFALRRPRVERRRGAAGRDGGRAT